MVINSIGLMFRFFTHAPLFWGCNALLGRVRIYQINARTCDPNMTRIAFLCPSISFNSSSYLQPRRPNRRLFRIVIIRIVIPVIVFAHSLYNRVAQNLERLLDLPGLPIESIR